jgi:tetratricopeptide (TPR) repeat protein
MRSRLPFLLLVAILLGAGIWYVTRDRGSPEERAKELFDEAYELAERGQFKKAIDRIKKCIDLEQGRNPVSYSNLGNWYYQLGQVEMAKQQYEKALKLDPSKANTRVAYAACLLKTARDRNEAWTMANRELNKLTEKDRRHPYVAYNLACLYAENDRPELALRHLAYAIRADPSCREDAKQDRSFDGIRETDQFRRLVR